MRNMSFKAIALMVLAAGPGMAADMAVKAPVYKAAPASVTSWTGFYVGGGGGYGMFNLDTSITQNGNLVSDNQSFGGRGLFGTVVAGFDYQFSDRWVAGVFTDWDFSDINGHLGDPYWEESGAIKQRWAWSVGGRLGYLIYPAVLSYVNAGFTETKFSRVNLFNFGLANRQEGGAGMPLCGMPLYGIDCAPHPFLAAAVLLYHCASSVRWERQVVRIATGIGLSECGRMYGLDANLTLEGNTVVAKLDCGGCGHRGAVCDTGERPGLRRIEISRLERPVAAP
jgi:opacity protein-like surface antigen